jgi:hypothetical protein
MTISDAEAIIKIAEERAALVRRMREAFDRGDNAEAMRLARLVAGIEEQTNESH